MPWKYKKTTRQRLDECYRGDGGVVAYVLRRLDLNHTMEAIVYHFQTVDGITVRPPTLYQWIRQDRQHKAGLAVSAQKETVL